MLRIYRANSSNKSNCLVTLFILPSFEIRITYFNNYIIFSTFLFQFPVPAATYYSAYDENMFSNGTETISEGDEAAPCLVSDVLYNHGQQVGTYIISCIQEEDFLDLF